MLYTINQLREEIFAQVIRVYQIFQDFFGEMYVDLQNLPSDYDISCYLAIASVHAEGNGDSYELTEKLFGSIKSLLKTKKPFILVYWPHVKVTNEHDKSVIIQDLYAKIELTSEGYIPTANNGFTLNRATYTMEQWESSYMHSHVSAIPHMHPSEFQKPCLGTGPILNTIINLKADICTGFDETRWMLFCHELSLYVTVESLKGVPYHRLENIGKGNLLYEYGHYRQNNSIASISIDHFYKVFTQGNLRDFILYYLRNGHMSIGFKNEEFVISMPYFDYIMDISNAFIDWFNSNYSDKGMVEACFDKGILTHAIVRDNTFCNPEHRTSYSDVSCYIGKPVCKFKGENVCLNILPPDEDSVELTTIIDHGLAMFVLYETLKIINYHYTNERNRNQKQCVENSTTALTPTTHQTVYYI